MGMDGRTQLTSRVTYQDNTPIATANKDRVGLAGGKGADFKREGYGHDLALRHIPDHDGAVIATRREAAGSDVGWGVEDRRTPDGTPMAF